MPDRRVAFSGWVIGLVLGVMVSFFGILGHAGIVSEVLGGGAGIFVAFLVTILVLARSAHQQ